MSGYRVDPAQLQESDARLDAAVRHSRVLLADLRGAGAELLGAGWHGAAASAFREGWLHWLAGCTAMLDSLEGIAAALGSSAHGYASTDESVRTGVVQAAS